jgi:hypothetical protein
LVLCLKLNNNKALSVASHLVAPLIGHFAIAIQTWLRKGEIEATKIICNAFNKKNFQSVLGDLRALTLVENLEDFLQSF